MRLEGARNPGGDCDGAALRPEGLGYHMYKYDVEARYAGTGWSARRSEESVVMELDRAA